MKKRVVASVLAAVMGLSTGIYADETKENAAPKNWDDPYEETVTITIGGLGNPQDMNLPDGRMQ